MQHDGPGNLEISGTLDHKDLFSIWKNITHSLISQGRGTELQRELDISQTGHRDGVFRDSYWDTAQRGDNSLQIAANNKEGTPWTYVDDESSDADMVTSSEYDSENEDDDVWDIPRDLIDDAAALPCRALPQTFEDIFENEEMVFICFVCFISLIKMLTKGFW